MNKFRYAIFLTALTAAIGCGETRDGSATVKTGVTSTAVARVPGGPKVSEVNLVVESVVAHRTRDAGAERTETARWEPLLATPLTIDLLKIAGTGATEELATAVVTEGYYDRVRITFGAGSTVKVDGTVLPLVIEDGTVAIARDEHLQNGKNYRLVFAIDAASSLEEKLGTYRFIPMVSLAAFDPAP